MSLTLTDPKQLIALLKKYRLWAKKKFGQNFLIDASVLSAIVDQANITADDLVYEIGPGPGVLTRELLPRAKKVVAVEIDDAILPVLRETTHFFRKKREIIHGHVLGIDLPHEPYKVVANIPYHLTSPILRKFLVETDFRPTSLTLLVQKEVGEKICNIKKKSILSLFIEAFGEAEICQIVPPEAFFPAPKVHSAILHISVLKQPKITTDPKILFFIIRQGFRQTRKKIKNNIPEVTLKQAGIDPNLRAENLELSDWEALATIMGKKV